MKRSSSATLRAEARTGRSAALHYRRMGWLILFGILHAYLLWYGDILFTFVMGGGMTLEGEGKDPFRLSAGDAFVIPPGMATRYADPTPDLELLEVTLPGNPPTTPL